MRENDTSNRRDFLRGRLLVPPRPEPDSTGLSAPASPDGRVVPGVEESDASASRDEIGGLSQTYLEHYSRNAMACEFQIMFNLRQYRSSAAAALRAFDLIERIEAQMSIYRESSEITEINRRAGLEPQPVAPQMFDLFLTARQLYEATGGAFDFTSGPLTRTWGFEKRVGRLPERQEIDEALARVGTDRVELNEEKRTIRFLQSGVEINLNAIGKGHALDRVAEMFQASGINDFVIHGGQSSVLAHGVGQEWEDESSGWIVGLSHPTLPGFRLCELMLRDRALSTSGNARQAFFHRGKRYGHVIDPRTGWPTDHCLSATVLAPNATLADGLSTAFFVMPVEEVERYCREHTEIAALLAINGVAPGQIELVWFNLSDNDWQCLI